MSSALTICPADKSPRVASCPGRCRSSDQSSWPGAVSKPCGECGEIGLKGVVHVGAKENRKGKRWGCQGPFCRSHPSRARGQQTPELAGLLRWGTAAHPGPFLGFLTKPGTFRGLERTRPPLPRTRPPAARRPPVRHTRACVGKRARGGRGLGGRAAGREAWPVGRGAWPVGRGGVARGGHGSRSSSSPPPRQQRLVRSPRAGVTAAPLNSIRSRRGAASGLR